MPGRRASLLLAAACLASLVVATPGARQDPPPDQPPFAEWLAALREEAVARGLRAEIVDAALASVEAPQEVVVARDRAQPERVQTLEGYVDQWMSSRTLTTARSMRTRHADALDRVSERYGIPAPMLLSVWGLESSFGRFTGSYPTISALATLAYDPRRSKLFRAELFEALTILDRGHISLDEMKGSWAGAMGQPQFMPSSYLRHAVDFDGDGRADIWRSEPDVFASIANYLVNAGWQSGERWGREVQVSRAARDRIDRGVPMRTAGCGALRQMTAARPLAEWHRLGVRLPGGGALPRADMAASLVRGERRSFLVYRNYLAIIDYNCSNSYAVAVGLLADRLW